MASQIASRMGVLVRPNGQWCGREDERFLLTSHVVSRFSEKAWGCVHA
jgi:hypothetical protein